MHYLRVSHARWTVNLIHLYFIIISRMQYSRLRMPVVKLARIARETGFIFWSKRDRKNLRVAVVRVFTNDPFARYNNIQ